MNDRPNPPTCVTCKWVKIRTQRVSRHVVGVDGNITLQETDMPTEYNCSHNIPLFNPVTGQTWDLNNVPRSCEHMRKFRGGDRHNNDKYSGGECGPDGKLWEAKYP